MVRNPWSSLPDSPPFVLADDKRAIEAFNQKARKNAIIQTDMLPEPFMGSLNAPVFVLLENPGAGGGGYVAYCVQKLLSRKSGHGTRLLVEVDLLTKE